MASKKIMRSVVATLSTRWYLLVFMVLAAPILKMILSGRATFLIYYFTVIGLPAIFFICALFLVASFSNACLQSADKKASFAFYFIFLLLVNLIMQALLAVFNATYFTFVSTTGIIPIQGSSTTLTLLSWVLLPLLFVIVYALQSIIYRRRT